MWGVAMESKSQAFLWRAAPAAGLLLAALFSAPADADTSYPEPNAFMAANAEFVLTRTAADASSKSRSPVRSYTASLTLEVTH